MGGHTSMIESDGKIIFGTDYLGGTNFIIETDDFRRMRRKIIPDPYRRSFVQSMTKINMEDREQIWISLKSSRPNSKDSILYTNNGGKTWNKYLEYDGSLFGISFCCLSNKDLKELYFNIENFQDRSMSSYKYIEQKACKSKSFHQVNKSKITQQKIMQIKIIEELKQEITGDPFFGRAISFALDNIGDVNDKKIVDVGCGNGEMSVFFALRGANVVGIDIEASVLASSKTLALKRHMKDECIFLNASAESIPIESDSIDIIFSKSTIQYMNREDVLAEYNRIIKPDGIIVLLENLPFNPFINIYRLRRRLFAKTPAEIRYVNSVRGYLTLTEVENFKHSFQEVTHKEYHLFSMFAIYLLPYESKIIKNIYSLLVSLDNLFLDRVYFTKYLAWYTAVICRRKKSV